MNSDFDFRLLELFNALILHLRNSTTHKSQRLSKLEKFKAELSVKLAFPFMEFYTDIIYPRISNNIPDDNLNELNTNPAEVQVLRNSDLNQAHEYYYGLDGDNTGSMLEKIFLEPENNQQALKKLSESVKNAIGEIGKKVQKKSIIFSGGDSILFKGFFKEEELKVIQDIYKKKTSGLTCSIGYGRSLTETYLALKLAKTKPGKNSIVGIKLKNREGS